MYEVTLITREEKDDVVKKEIENLGGKILEEELLGRRKFTYPIKKETAGFYTTYVFEIDPEKLNALIKSLRLKTQLIRYLITTKKPVIEKPQKAEEKSLEKEISAPETKSEIAAPKPAEKEEAGKEEIKKTAKKKTAPKSEKKKDKTETTSNKLEEKPVETIKTEEKTVAPEKPAEEKKESNDEEERLKALEEKLEEILKN